MVGCTTPVAQSGSALFGSDGLQYLLRKRVRTVCTCVETCMENLYGDIMYIYYAERARLVDVRHDCELPVPIDTRSHEALA